ncbi:MAG: hypothetical protein PHY94_00935 [Candidatus Omnitrophica bacterium]|nr:hypothetical protein [Candidatus Omnitrophota bacterium]
MRGKNNLAFFLLLLVFSGAGLSFGHAQDEYLNLQVVSKVFRGKITEINRLKSEISISGTDEQGKPKEMTFRISEKTRFLKNKVYVSFSSIMQGYEVVVDYYDNPKVSAPFEIKTITLLQEGPGY